MRLSIASLVALAALVACHRAPTTYSLATADPRTVRHLPAGDVVGGVGRYGAFAWLGIPYAKPPVGALRWRAPEPAERWSDTRSALTFGAPCVQYGSRFGGIPGVQPGQVGGSEDCLTLNVWSPAGDVAKLPVIFWIHGGGNSVGHTQTYDGGHLATTHQLVVVTVQYRLGPLGWFRNAAIRADATSDAERSGNFATLDLVRALDCVRDNVADFGGDPGNVTIAGESAGAQNVYTLLLSPAAHGLFHRAIAQSGGLWSYSPAQAENPVDAPEPGDKLSSTEMAVRLLTRSGHAGSRADALAEIAGMPAANAARDLRAIPARELVADYDAAPSGMIDLPRVIRDGTVLPAGNLLATLGRTWNRVPVLVGTNRDENKLFMFTDPQYVRQRLWVIPYTLDQQRYDLTAEYLARWWKAHGADMPATEMAKAEPRTFVYRFDWRDEPVVLGADLAKLLGAAHAFEIPFMFGHFDLGREARFLYAQANEAGRTALSRAMMSYWAEFAYAGAPRRGRTGDLPPWEAWDGARTMQLDTETGGGIRLTSAAPETGERVLADLAADPRFASPRDRCRVVHEVAEFGRLLTPDDYARMGCAAYPYAAYPWDG